VLKTRKERGGGKGEKQKPYKMGRERGGEPVNILGGRGQGRETKPFPLGEKKEIRLEEKRDVGLRPGRKKSDTIPSKVRKGRETYASNPRRRIERRGLSTVKKKEHKAAEPRRPDAPTDLLLGLIKEKIRAGRRKKSGGGHYIRRRKD